MKFNIVKIVMAVLLLLGMAVVCFPGLSGAAITGNTKVTQVIVIDPGHGGIDPGKIGVGESLEKEINLSIAMHTKKVLEEEGYGVILTRSDGDGLYADTDRNKKASDMKKRCEIIENAGADIVISIHQNSFTDSEVSGAQVFYYRHSKEGKLLADCIQQNLIKMVDNSNTRVSKANEDYYMLLHTKCPAVIVECGFLSNPAEEKLLLSEEYQKSIARAITAGIKDYFL